MCGRGKKGIKQSRTWQKIPMNIAKFTKKGDKNNFTQERIML